MQYRITIEEVHQKKEGQNYPERIEIYQQTTNKEIDLLAIIAAFNKNTDQK